MKKALFTLFLLLGITGVIFLAHSSEGGYYCEDPSQGTDAKLVDFTEEEDEEIENSDDIVEPPVVTSTQDSTQCSAADFLDPKMSSGLHIIMGVPPDYHTNPENYPGSADGGCGTYAILAAESQLQLVIRGGYFLPQEWRAIQSQIDPDEDGASNQKDEAAYWKNTHNYCHKRYGPLINGPFGYQRFMRKLQRGGECAMVLYMTNGESAHIETVAHVGLNYIVTNMYGKQGIIAGTYLTGLFRHKSYPEYNMMCGAAFYLDTYCPCGPLGDDPGEKGDPGKPGK